MRLSNADPIISNNSPGKNAHAITANATSRTTGDTAAPEADTIARIPTVISIYDMPVFCVQCMPRLLKELSGGL